MYPKHPAKCWLVSSSSFLLSLLFMNLSLLLFQQNMTSSRTRVCHVQTYFQHHLACVRIMNRSREKTNQPTKRQEKEGVEKKKDRERQGKDDQIVLKSVFWRLRTKTLQVPFMLCASVSSSVKLAEVSLDELLL